MVVSFVALCNCVGGYKRFAEIYRSLQSRSNKSDIQRHNIEDCNKNLKSHTSLRNLTFFLLAISSHRVTVAFNEISLCSCHT
jgi:hypothetical protein